MRYSSASFTGHRPDKIQGWKLLATTIEKAIRERLRQAIIKAAEEGVECFNSGAAPGVDLWAADEVLRLRKEGSLNPTTHLRLLLPYPTFSASFTPSEQALYNSIVERMEEGDEVVEVCAHYHPGCYNMRNDRLAEECDLMIAYYQGATGGTRYTLRKAQSLGRKVTNLFQAELFD